MKVPEYYSRHHYFGTTEVLCVFVFDICDRKYYLHGVLYVVLINQVWIGGLSVDANPFYLPMTGTSTYPILVPYPLSLLTSNPHANSM